MGDASQPPSSPPIALALEQPSCKKKNKACKPMRAFRNAFRSFPIITPACKFPVLPGGRFPDSKSTAGSRVTGTLFGYRKGRVTLSIQENSRTLPTAVLELAMQTQALQKEMGLGMVRIAMECEKRPNNYKDKDKEKMELLEEPMWTMFCNGKKMGYSMRREPTEEDLHVMNVLKAVSMGAGVLPLPQSQTPGTASSLPEAEETDGELAYMRAHFDRVMSKDSQTLYMVTPDGSNCPDLSVFFVRV